MTITRSRKLGAFVVVVALVLAAVAWIASTRKTSDFALSSDHSAVSVMVDSQAVLAVTIASKSDVQSMMFTFSRPPAGITVSATPDSSGDPHLAVVTVEASPTARPGRFALGVTGTSSGTRHTLSVPVTVTGYSAASRGITTAGDVSASKSATALVLPAPLSVVIRPSLRTISHGPAYYSVVVNPYRQMVPVHLTVTGLPAGITGSFSPGRLASGAGYELITTDTLDAAPGLYQFTVHATVGTQTATAQAYLHVVNFVAKSFTISATAIHPLYPGSTAPLNLVLTNTFKRDLDVASLHVAITGTSNHACTASNFAIVQYSGPTLVVPAHTQRSLIQLGVAPTATPKLKMLNLPTNQDACKNITINLKYTGTGSGT